MKNSSKILIAIIYFLFSLQSMLSANEEIPITYKTKLDKTVSDLANKLFISSKIKYSSNQNIAITSFVNLHKFDTTSYLGRTLSESFFDELFTRGFNISDFRGQNTISINQNGEYYLTRNIELLKKDITNTFILVGTYTIIENTILINARIMDNKTGKILASAKSYYDTDDCKILNNCKRQRRINIVSHDNYFVKQYAIKKTNNKNIKNMSMPIVYNKKRKIINQQINEISLIN